MTTNPALFLRPGLLAWLLLSCLALVGCTHVKPYERDILAEYIMRADRDALGDAFPQHMWFSREAASGGRGVGGGGCGCN